MIAGDGDDDGDADGGDDDGDGDDDDDDGDGDVDDDGLVCGVPAVCCGSYYRTTYKDSIDRPHTG